MLNYVVYPIAPNYYAHRESLAQKPIVDDLQVGEIETSNSKCKLMKEYC